MFKLTRREAQVVVLLASALVLGSVVREWRARRATEARAARVEAEQEHGED